MVLVHFDPSKDRAAIPGSKMGFGFQGVFIVSYPITEIAPKSKGKDRTVLEAPVETGSIVLKIGINQVDTDQWQHALTQLALSHSGSALEIQRQINRGVIKTYHPDDGKSGRNSTEFSSYDDLIEIIGASKDRLWLEYSLQVERRSSPDDGGDIQQLLRNRLKELDEDSVGLRSNGVISF